MLVRELTGELCSLSLSLSLCISGHPRQWGDPCGNGTVRTAREENI